MLEVTNLRAGYGAINVLWDVSLSVEKGKLTTIIGNVFLALGNHIPALAHAVSTKTSSNVCTKILWTPESILPSQARLVSAPSCRAARCQVRMCLKPYGWR